MGDDWAWMSADGGVPWSTRIVETPTGLMRVRCGPTSAEVIRVGPDGWTSALDGVVRVERSLAALNEAFREVGLPGSDANELAESIRERWEADVRRPPDRTPRERARSRLQVARLWVSGSIHLLGQLARLALRAAVRLGRREPRWESSASPLLGTGEYGVLRIVRGSTGWIEFEFWAESGGRVSVYAADGWLRLSAERMSAFDLSEQGATSALTAQGVGDHEAKELAALVVSERLGRIAAVT